MFRVMDIYLLPWELTMAYDSSCKRIAVRRFCGQVPFEAQDFQINQHRLVLRSKGQSRSWMVFWLEDRCWLGRASTPSSMISPVHV